LFAIGIASPWDGLALSVDASNENGGDGAAADIDENTKFPKNDERSVQEVVHRIQTMRAGEFVGIGTPPAGALDAWRDRLTNDVIYTHYRYQIHLNVHHPDRVAGFENFLEAMVETIRDPEAVALQTDGRAQFIRPLSSGLNLIVIVRIAELGYVKNGISTVIPRGRRSTIRRLNKSGRIVWGELPEAD
jgi:hypothetical protein